MKIISVHNKGNHEKEYVLLEAIGDGDIGSHILADTTYTDGGKISNKLRNTFWFPDRVVEEGDLISVWTKTGTDTKTTNDSGTPVHRFYWNLSRPIWNNDGDCAFLGEFKPGYQTFRV